VDCGRVREAIGVRSGRPRGAVRPRAGLPFAAAKASVGAAVCLAAGTLAIAGCGSSKSEPEDTAFVSNANAACRAAFAEAQALKTPRHPNEIPTRVAHLDPIAYSLLSKLNAVSPPPTKQAEFTRMLNLWRQEISLAAARAAAIKAGNIHRAVAINEEGHSVDIQFDSAATNLGLSECSRNL
jgi:hypothetical protein